MAFSLIRFSTVLLILCPQALDALALFAVLPVVLLLGQQLLRNELLPQQEDDGENGKKRKGIKGLRAKDKKDGGKADE